MASLLGDIAEVGTTVTVDQASINNIAKMLIIVVAVGLFLWVVAKEVANK